MYCLIRLYYAFAGRRRRPSAASASAYERLQSDGFPAIPKATLLKIAKQNEIKYSGTVGSIYICIKYKLNIINIANIYQRNIWCS